MRKRLKLDRLAQWVLALCAGVLVVCIVAVTSMVFSRGMATFTVNGIDPVSFLTGTLWQPDRPVSEGGPVVGALPFLVGSVLVCSLAVAVGFSFSLAVAILMTEIAPSHAIARWLQSLVELLSGIPSVVYGWVGLSVLVPFIRNHLGGLGFSVLAAVVVLSVMVLPTMTRVCADTLQSIPPEIKQASLALGATRWQTIRFALLPAARRGIATAAVLGLARAFGEAMAVQMVIGNTKVIPKSLLDQAVTLTSGITMEMGHSVMGSLWNNALWSLALVLMVISFLFILAVHCLSGGKLR